MKSRFETPHFMGAIDEIYGPRLYGWAANLDRAAYPVEVEALEHDTVIATVTADRPRSDLVAHGIGTGNHGFELNVPFAAVDARDVKLRIAGTDHYLQFRGLTVIRIERAPPHYAGFIDNVDGSTIRGWVLDSNNLSQTSEIEVVEGERVLARAMANISRPDLRSYDLDSVEHGFEITIAVAPLEVRSVRVRVRGSEFYLPHEGTIDVTVRGVEPLYIGAIDRVEGHFIRGWAADAYDPSRSVRVEAVVDDRVVNESVADGSRPDLAASGIGNGANGFELRVEGTGRVRVRICGTEAYLMHGTETFVIVGVEDGTSDAGAAASVAAQEERYHFYHSVIESIPGWLQRGAAIRTMDILEFQERNDVRGGFLEIGVYCGKYFAILARYARRSGAMLVGVEPFLYESEADVWRILDAAIGDYRPNTKLLARFSRQCDVQSLLAELRDRARFISIDGSHERDDVFYDLTLGEQLLAPGGVIAVDDFINPLALGVNEAVNAFFSQQRSVVPWCYIENKLFLCERSWAPRYRSMLERIVASDGVERHSKFYRERARSGRHLVEAKMWGSVFLLLPHG